MSNTEIVTLIGVGLTFFIGVFNLIITFRNVKKTTFINSVTASRIKYIQDLRENISRFCALAYSYNKRIYKLQKEQVWELHKEADSLKFLIRLYLNPEDKYWDNKIINLIDQILLKSGEKNDPTSSINELITITQYLLKLEWEGAKKESEIGSVSDIKKKELYNKYVELHKKIQK
ncbi:hypothetical protein ACX0HA_09545 [Flavobacterium hauense]